MATPRKPAVEETQATEAPILVQDKTELPLVTYRCTRNKLYANPDEAGHTNLWGRSGEYLVVADETEARAIMAQKHPEDEGDFTAELY